MNGVIDRVLREPHTNRDRHTGSPGKGSGDRCRSGEDIDSRSIRRGQADGGGLHAAAAVAVDKRLDNHADGVGRTGTGAAEAHAVAPGRDSHRSGQDKRRDCLRGGGAGVDSTSRCNCRVGEIGLRGAADRVGGQRQADRCRCAVCPNLDGSRYRRHRGVDRGGVGGRETQGTAGAHRARLHVGVGAATDSVGGACPAAAQGSAVAPCGNSHGGRDAVGQNIARLGRLERDAARSARPGAGGGVDDPRGDVWGDRVAGHRGGHCDRGPAAPRLGSDRATNRVGLNRGISLCLEEQSA